MMNTATGQTRRARGSATTLETVAIHLSSSNVHTVAGGLAGAISAIVSCPLDVIKTKLQAQGGLRILTGGATGSPSPVYKGFLGTARTIWREERLRGLYRGLSPMMLGYVPTWAVYLTVYNSAQNYLSTQLGTVTRCLQLFGIVLMSSPDNGFLVNACASLAGGATSTMVTNPIWVIKTRLMSQSNLTNHQTPWHYRGTMDAIIKMYRYEGMRSFYSGLTPAMLGLTHVAIQFPLYEVFKARFTGIEAGKKESATDRAAHFWGLASAVFLSKVIASTATYPHEVVRTRLQTQQRHNGHNGSHPAANSGGDHGRPPGSQAPNGKVNILQHRGTIETCKVILREEGWRGFYAGLGTNLIRAVPSAMTTLLAFEYIKKAFFDAQKSAGAKRSIVSIVDTT